MVALVADNNMHGALRGLLSRPEGIGIRGIQSEVLAHPRRDPAVFRESADFLRPWLSRADYALVAFDRHGCGSFEPRQALEAAVERRLSQNGWVDRCAVVVPDPELEAWVWGDYSEVAALLGWSPSGAALRDWLTAEPVNENPRIPKWQSNGHCTS